MVAGELVEGVDFGSIISTTMGTGYDIAFGIGLIILVGALVWFIVYYSMHNKRIRIRYQTKQGSFVIDDKARRKIIDGVEFWSLMKMKMVVTPPPAEAINLTKNGKLTAECYMTEGTQEPVWIEDNGPSDKFQTVLLTTQERALLVSRVIKAQMRRKKGLLDTITQLATPIALVMVVIVMLVFWESIAQPAKDMAKLNQELMVENEKISSQNARILSVMAGKLEAGELNIRQDIPPDAGGG